jgi:hypothetical protein
MRNTNVTHHLLQRIRTEKKQTVDEEVGVGKPQITGRKKISQRQDSYCHYTSGLYLYMYEDLSLVKFVFFETSILKFSSPRNHVITIVVINQQSEGQPMVI